MFLMFRHVVTCNMDFLCCILLGLVVLTAMAGYAMAPAAFDPIGFTMVTLGTGLTSASANAINQVITHFLETNHG